MARGFGGLENDGVAAGKRGRDFPRGHEQRKIPRNDLSRHAERLRRFAGKRVFQLVRPARVIKKMRGHERQIHVAAFLDGLAAVHRFEHGQFARLLLDDARDAIKIFAPLASRHLAPDLFVGAPRGLHRLVHVRAFAERNFGELFLRGRVDGWKIFLPTCGATNLPSMNNSCRGAMT